MNLAFIFAEAVALLALRGTVGHAALRDRSTTVAPSCVRSRDEVSHHHEAGTLAAAQIPVATGHQAGCRTPRPAPAPRPPARQVPPPLLIPQTGRLLPNLPTPVGAGPGGAETRQDRAARCAHQAGVYGDAAGNPAAYINSCINQ